jgi:hypothetical protein
VPGPFEKPKGIAAAGRRPARKSKTSALGGWVAFRKGSSAVAAGGRWRNCDAKPSLQAEDSCPDRRYILAMTKPDRSRYQIVPIGSLHTGFALKVDGLIRRSSPDMISLARPSFDERMAIFQGHRALAALARPVRGGRTGYGRITPPSSPASDP